MAGIRDRAAAVVASAALAAGYASASAFIAGAIDRSLAMWSGGRIADAARFGGLAARPEILLPLAMVVTEDGVDVATAGSILRLEESAALREVILRARTVVVAEADERIVRETLVPTFRTKPKPASEQRNDLQAA